jgi:hypothetical protein
VIELVGHSGKHAPHAMQSLVIFIAMSISPVEKSGLFAASTSCLTCIDYPIIQ